jgi:hypothetical protein
MDVAEDSQQQSKESSQSMSLSNTRSNEDGTNGHDDVDGAIDKMDVAEDSQQQSKESSQSSGFGDIDYDSFSRRWMVLWKRDWHLSRWLFVFSVVSVCIFWVGWFVFFRMKILEYVCIF